MYMDAAPSASVRYAQQMADDLDLEEGEDAEQDEIRVRCAAALKRKMEGIAKAETRSRVLRKRLGKVSLNRLMKLVIERYIVAWSAENGVPAPTSEDDSEGIERGARAINARKQREGRAKPKQ